MRISLIFFLFTLCCYSQQPYTQDETHLIESGNINTALPIYQTTDPHQQEVLLASSQNVDPRNSLTKILVERMKLSLLATKHGVGIAAPQVGVNRKIIWVQRFDREGHPLEYFINPEILWRSEILNLGPEGDLSIPDFRDQFYRSKVISVQYQDLDGKVHQEIMEDFTAVIFQHETDHLSGILITDKKEKEKNRSYEKVDAYIRLK